MSSGPDATAAQRAAITHALEFFIEDLPSTARAIGIPEEVLAAAHAGDLTALRADRAALQRLRLFLRAEGAVAEVQGRIMDIVDHVLGELSGVPA